MKSDMQTALSSFEQCTSYEELKTQLQLMADCYGFSGFTCLDIANPQYKIPYYEDDNGHTLEDDYETSVWKVDPCLLKARRAKTRFAWTGVAIAPMFGLKKSKARELHEVSRNQTIDDGLIVPYHFLDPKGRIYSSLIIFSWKNSMPDFRTIMKEKQMELQIIMSNWAQKAIDLIMEMREQQPDLINSSKS